MQNDAKNLKNDLPWNMGTHLRVLARAILWIPTRQGLDGFQKYLPSCALDESSHSIELEWKEG